MIDRTGLLFKILEIVSTSPESQLSVELKDEALELVKSDQTTYEQVHSLFEHIYNGCCESSQFVKELVNPEFTKGYQ